MESFSNRTQRQVAQRPAATGQAHNAASVAMGSDNEVRRTTAAHQTRLPKQKMPLWQKIGLIVGGVIVLALAGYAAWQVLGVGSGIDKSRYQAVFLTNGQVYFGKLDRMNGEYYKLKDVYYLQASGPAKQADANNPQETAQTGGDVQIIKLGDEIHGPEDQMIIGKDQVIFYENLKAKDGSKVVQAIADYQAKKKQ